MNPLSQVSNELYKAAKEMLACYDNHDELYTYLTFIHRQIIAYDNLKEAIEQYEEIQSEKMKEFDKLVSMKERITFHSDTTHLIPYPNKPENK